MPRPWPRKNPLVLALLRGLGRMGGSMPHTALLLAGLIGKLSAPFRRVSTAEVRVMYPQLSRRQASSLLRHVLTMEMRSQIIVKLSDSSKAAIIGSTDFLESITPPLILATFHVGPMFGLFATLRRLEMPFYVMQRHRGSQHGAAEIHRGLATLNQQGVVAVPIDPDRAATLTVELFGKPLVLARGAFALSRISGVPIAPILPVWRKGSVSAVIGETIHPLAGPAGNDLETERSQAEGIARWLEEHFRNHPGDIGLRTLKLFSPA